MSSAVITYCGHFFHGNCLRKWLYVQETCPMCHQTVRPTSPSQSRGSAEGESAPPQRDAWPDLVAQEEEENTANGLSQETQSDAVTTEQLEETHHPGDGDGGTADKRQSADSHRTAVQGLCFSSSGDFVGFVSPQSTCSPGDTSSSPEPLSKTVNMHNPGEVTGEGDLRTATSRQPTSDAPDVAASESRRDCNGAGVNVNSSSCSAVKPNTEGNYDCCVGTQKLRSVFEAPETNYSDENSSGVSFCDRQKSVKSCNASSELLNSVAQAHTYSDLDLGALSGAAPVTEIPRLASDSTLTCMSSDHTD